MDFFCINFVFTLLEEASKWDSFKKFCCIYISISNLRCIIYWYIFCDFLVETSNWPSVVYVSYFFHNVCAQSTLFTMFVHKALHICHNISYTYANPEIWYWILFALACHFMHSGINLYFSKHLKLQKLYHDKCRLVIVDEWFSDNDTIFLSYDG